MHRVLNRGKARQDAFRQVDGYEMFREADRWASANRIRLVPWCDKRAFDPRHSPCYANKMKALSSQD